MEVYRNFNISISTVYSSEYPTVENFISYLENLEIDFVEPNPKYCFTDMIDSDPQIEDKNNTEDNIVQKFFEQIIQKFPEIGIKVYETTNTKSSGYNHNHYCFYNHSQINVIIHTFNPYTQEIMDIESMSKDIMESPKSDEYGNDIYKYLQRKLVTEYAKTYIQNLIYNDKYIDITSLISLK